MTRAPSPRRRRQAALSTLGLGVALACATAAGAAPQAPPPAPAGARPPGPALFISPFGEPFRSAHGLADWFSGADADHDGVLTPKEFAADGLRFLRVLDTDHDGRVDGFENTAYENDVAPEILPQSAFFRPGRDEDAGGPALRARGLDGASTFGLLDEPQPVRGADQNYDGKITPDEQAKAAARRFAFLDPEGTGRLTLPPLQARMAQREAPPGGFARFFRRRPD